MTRPLLRPSPGFLVLLTSWLLAAGLLGWGLSRPDLDRAWLSLLRAESPAFAGFTDEESELLQKVIRSHPSLALERLDGRAARLLEPTEGGWTRLERAHLLVAPSSESPDSPATVELGVEVSGGAGAFPVAVEVGDEALTFDSAGLQTLTLPRPTGGVPAVRIVRIVRGEYAPGPGEEPVEARLAVAGDGQPDREEGD